MSRIRPYIDIDTGLQRLTMHRVNGKPSMYLNGAYQFWGESEREYHESLVRPVVAVKPASVLILGGGDGLAARTLLEKYPAIRIVLVDIDEGVVRHSGTDHEMLAMNRGALQRSHVIIQDAYDFVMENDPVMFDGIVMDLTVPQTVEELRIYSLEFFSRLREWVKIGGKVSVQASTEPLTSYIYSNIMLTFGNAEKSEAYKSVEAEGWIVSAWRVH